MLLLLLLLLLLFQLSTSSSFHLFIFATESTTVIVITPNQTHKIRHTRRLFLPFLLLIAKDAIGGLLSSTKAFCVDSRNDKKVSEIHQQCREEGQHQKERQGKIRKDVIRPACAQRITMKDPKQNEVLVRNNDKEAQEETDREGRREAFQHERPQHGKCHVQDTRPYRRQNQCFAAALGMQTDHCTNDMDVHRKGSRNHRSLFVCLFVCLFVRLFV